MWMPHYTRFLQDEEVCLSFHQALERANTTLDFWVNAWLFAGTLENEELSEFATTKKKIGLTGLVKSYSRG